MAENDAWVEQIKGSDRPEGLKKLILEIDSQVWSLYGPSNGHRVVGFGATPGSGSARAEEEANRLFNRLTRAKDRAVKVVLDRSLNLASRLAEYVSTKTGWAGDINAEIAKLSFMSRVERYLESGVNDLKPIAARTVQSWVSNEKSIQELRDLLAPLVERARYQARTVVRTEIQNAYVDMTRQALAGQAMIERVVMPGACDACKSRAGIQPYSDDAFWTHPQCACTWSKTANGRQESPALFSASAVVF